MNTIAIITCSILIAATFVGIFFYSRGIKNQTYRIIINIVTCVSLILSLTLIIASAFIPKSANKLITNGIQHIETTFDEQQEGLSQQEMSIEEIQTAIQNAKQVTDDINETIDGNLILRLIAQKSFVNTLSKTLTDLNEQHIGYFETNDLPLTIDNILLYTQQQVQAPIHKWTKVIQITCIIIAFGIALGMFVIAIIVKKDDDDDKLCVNTDDKPIQGVYCD